MKVNEWEIDKIRPYENNPRQNEDAVDKVAASIKEFGWQQPIVVDRDGVIIVGHTRWKAAKQLGLTTAPVTVAEDLTEELLSGYLYSANVPDPELIIRPSGEMRTSNFLLWQSAYSEYVFMDVLWPDFAPEHLDQAIEEYHRRNRRFGGT